MRGLRLWLIIIRRSGVGKMALGLIIVVLVCAGILNYAEQSITTYGDGLWYCWAVISTVGLGDFTALTHVGRTVTIVLSLYSAVCIAVLTGVIVDYYNERREAQRDETLSEFLDKLEHLPELEEDELQRIADRVRSMR